MSKKQKKDLQKIDESVAILESAEDTFKVDLSWLKDKFYIKRIQSADKIGRKDEQT